MPREVVHPPRSVEPPQSKRPVDSQRKPPATALRSETLAVFVLVSLGLLLFGSPDRLLVGSFNDDGVYVTLGKAIAEGEGYRSIHLPGSPVHTKYPPGLPALLALFWWIGGSLPAVVVLAHASNLLAVAGAAALSWWYGRAELKLSSVPLVVFGLGPFFLEAALHYNSLILSEPYFLLGWFAVLVVYSRLARNETARGRLRVACILGLLLAASSMFRIQGVVLAAAILALLAIERRGARAWLVCAIASTAPVIAWLLVHRTLRERGPVSSHPDELSYVDWVRSQGDAGSVSGAIQSAGRNIGEYAGTFAHYASGSDAIGSVLVVAFTVAAIVGIWRTRRHVAVLGATILAMTAVVLFWPFSQDRLALSVLPVIGLAAAAAADALLRAFSVRGRWIVTLTLVALAGVLAVRQVELRREALRGAEAGSPPATFSPSFVGYVNSRYIESASHWLAAHAEPGDRVLTEFPAAIYLHTGLAAAGSMVADDDVAEQVFHEPGEFLARRILEDGVTIVTLGNLSHPIARDVAAVMEHCPGVLSYAGGVDGRPIPAFYRVVPDERCLRERLIAP